MCRRQVAGATLSASLRHHNRKTLVNPWQTVIAHLLSEGKGMFDSDYGAQVKTCVTRDTLKSTSKDLGRCIYDVKVSSLTTEITEGYTQKADGS